MASSINFFECIIPFFLFLNKYKNAWRVLRLNRDATPRPTLSAILRADFIKSTKIKYSTFTFTFIFNVIVNLNLIFSYTQNYVLLLIMRDNPT